MWSVPLHAALTLTACPGESVTTLPPPQGFTSTLPFTTPMSELPSFPTFIRIVVPLMAKVVVGVVRTTALSLAVPLMKRNTPAEKAIDASTADACGSYTNLSKTTVEPWPT